MSISYCPHCGELLKEKIHKNNSTEDLKGFVYCEKHGEIYVDMEP